MRVSTCARAEINACFVRGGWEGWEGGGRIFNRPERYPGRAETRSFSRDRISRTLVITDRRDLLPSSDEVIHHPREISTSAINGFRRRFNTIEHSRTLRAMARCPFQDRGSVRGCTNFFFYYLRTDENDVEVSRIFLARSSRSNRMNNCENKKQPRASGVTPSQNTPACSSSLIAQGPRMILNGLIGN